MAAAISRTIGHRRWQALTITVMGSEYSGDGGLWQNFAPHTLKYTWYTISVSSTETAGALYIHLLRRNKRGFAVLAKFWPSGGRRMITVVSDNYPEYWKPNPLHAQCIKWLGEVSIFRHIGQILALWWPKMFHFMRDVYIAQVSLQEWFHSWPRWPNFGRILVKQCLQ